MSFLSTLYVGNVAYSSNEADLTNLFSQYGKVLSTEIKRGFAFVKFETVPSAQAAAQALDNHLFNGRNLKVNFSKSEPHPSNRQTPFQPTPNDNNNNNNNSNQQNERPQQQRVSYKENSLHVANLPHTITEEKLREVFEAYGILDIHIIRTRKICFAIIELSSEENTTKAIADNTLLVIDGREIAVTKQVIVPERHNNNFGSRGGRGRGFRGNYRRGFGRGGNFQRNDQQTFRIDNNLHNNNVNNQNNNEIDEQQKQRGDFYDNNKYRGQSYRYRGDMFGGRGQYGSRGGQYRPRGRGGYRARGRNNFFNNNNNNNAHSNPSSE